MGFFKRAFGLVAGVFAAAAAVGGSHGGAVTRGQSVSPPSGERGQTGGTTARIAKGANRSAALSSGYGVYGGRGTFIWRGVALRGNRRNGSRFSFNR